MDMPFGTNLFTINTQVPPHTPEQSLNGINKIDSLAISYGEYTPIKIYHFLILLFCYLDVIGDPIIHWETQNPMTNINVKHFLRYGIKVDCDY